MRIFFFKHDRTDWLSNISNTVLRIKYGYLPTYTHCAIMIGCWWFEYSYHGLVMHQLNEAQEHYMLTRHNYVELGDDKDGEYLQAAWFIARFVQVLHPKFNFINLIKVSVFNIPVVSCVGLIQLILNMEWEVLSPDGLYNTLSGYRASVPRKE